jgi:hypothetical protein
MKSTERKCNCDAVTMEFDFSTIFDNAFPKPPRRNIFSRIAGLMVVAILGIVFWVDATIDKFKADMGSLIVAMVLGAVLILDDLETRYRKHFPIKVKE